MKKVEMTVIDNKKIARDTFELQLENSYIATNAIAGQFVYILIPGFTLRRPISIADINREKNQITLLFKVLGKGTNVLSNFKKGMKVDVLGPNGNGFPNTMEPGKTALLIGGGIGVPPLYYLGKKLQENGINVVSILGFQSKDHVFYEEAFQSLGKTIIVTDDGTYQNKGFVTDMLHTVEHFDEYYTCGPTGMLKAVTNQLKEKDGYISLEERMGCGVGACAACFIQANTEAGYKKICHDGPVFAAKEVIL